MKKKLLITAIVVVAMVCMLTISVSAAAPAPQKPTLSVDFGEVDYIDGFTAPSELYVDTDERVVLVDEDGNYVTYPTYYVTKNQATFDFDFSKLNGAQSIEYKKQSVVLLEIPDGVTTISNGYFGGTGNFPKCIYVQFPGSVTSYGSSLFGSYNSVIESVEFLDGTEPITMGDGMFGSQHNGGTTNLKYVKFPNNLVSIGNSTFGKSWQSKTIVLGANLKSIGTNFFGESTPNGKDTFIYVSDNFFSDTAMFEKLFGGFDQWHNNYLKITLFYTGTEQQAKDFIAKGLAVQTGYLWDDNKVTLVSASNYVYETHKPTQNASLTMVYDMNACDAFYNGEHVNGAPTYSFAGAKYITDYCENVNCVNCGKGTSKAIIDPLFDSKGYSKSDDAFMYDIKVNHAAIAEYKAFCKTKFDVDVELNYGLAVSSNISYTTLINADGAVVANDVLKIIFDGTEYSKLQVKFNNVDTDNLKALYVHACAYIIENGEVSYVGDGTTGKVSTTICYNDIEDDDETDEGEGTPSEGDETPAA